MRLGTAKTARESAKSLDEFEAPPRRACLLGQRSGSQLCAEPMRFVFSIQAAKSNASLRSTRRIENCDAIPPDKYIASPREAYRAIARPSARFDAWANSLPVLRSLITNVLFSPSVDHGPRDTSLNSTKRQSVTSVSCNPR